MWAGLLQRRHVSNLNKLRRAGLPYPNPHLEFTLRYLKMDGGGIRERWPLKIASARWKTVVQLCSVLLLTLMFLDISI